MRALLLLPIAVLALAGFPCGQAPPSAPLPQLDYPAFVAKAEPELLKSCGFSNCHGAETRPMRIYSPAGTRITKGLSSEGLTEAEHRANYDRVVVWANVTSATFPDLLRKPLQLEEGGAGHGGVDRFGRNVYSGRDGGWLVLHDWLYPDGGTTGAGGGGGSGGQGGGDTGGSGGTGGQGGSGPTCLPAAIDLWTPVSVVVRTDPATCGRAECHTPENRLDAGCFLPTSCESVRAGGCMTPSVVPCSVTASKLYRYTGAKMSINGMQVQFKSHNSELRPEHAAVIGAWIDAGAPCLLADGGIL